MGTPQPWVMANLVAGRKRLEGAVGMLERPSQANPGLTAHMLETAIAAPAPEDWSLGKSCWGLDTFRGGLSTCARHVAASPGPPDPEPPHQRPASLLRQPWVYGHGCPQGCLRPGNLPSLLLPLSSVCLIYDPA